MADDLKGVIDEMKQLRIAIASLNPDPVQTIQAYRAQRAAQQRAADQLVVATEALVRTTKRLAWATWALVAFTVISAGEAILRLLGGAR
jgi:hypothetical protein